MEKENIIISGIFKKDNRSWIVKLCGLFITIVFFVLYYFNINFFINKYLLIYLGTILIVIGSLMCETERELEVYPDYISYKENDDVLDFPISRIRNLNYINKTLSIELNSHMLVIKNLENGDEVIKEINDLLLIDNK